MAQLSKDQFNKARKVVTGKIRCSYVSVFKPRENPNSGEMEYSMELMIPKSDKPTVTAVKKSIKAMEAHKFPNGRPKSKEWFQPLLDADSDMVELDDGREVTIAEKRPETKGCYLIRAKKKADQGPVPVVDRHKQEIEKESDFQSGDYARVSINLHPFSVGKNAGVTAFLNAIQVVEKGDPLGGGVNVDEEFDEWEEEETADDENWDD